MQKLHVRLSVEVKIPDKLFREIVEDNRLPSGGFLDVEVSEIADKIDWDSAKPCLKGWDEGGYIPSSWLEYDVKESGLYETEGE